MTLTPLRLLDCVISGVFIISSHFPTIYQTFAWSGIPPVWSINDGIQQLNSSKRTCTVVDKSVFTIKNKLNILLHVLSFHIHVIQSQHGKRLAVYFWMGFVLGQQIIHRSGNWMGKICLKPICVSVQMVKRLETSSFDKLHCDPTLYLVPQDWDYPIWRDDIVDNHS